MMFPFLHSNVHFTNVDFKRKTSKCCKMLYYSYIYFALKFGNLRNISYIYSMKEKLQTYGFVHEIPA